MLIIDSSYQSKNYNSRIHSLILHYTQEDFNKSLESLTQGKVSSHYLVPEHYVDNKPTVYKLVDESLRAWHAGVSYWQGLNNINDTSIGIEIVNLGYQDKDSGERCWYPFTDNQIEVVIALAKDIIKRYDIVPTCIVGHSDIAPERKIDPGPLFPWRRLALKEGIGAWYNEEEVEENFNTLKELAFSIDIAWVQKSLNTYGYNVEISGVLDQKTKTVLQAFQMHFRPSNYSGNPDYETCAILDNLVKKYFSERYTSIFENSSEDKVFRQTKFTI